MARIFFSYCHKDEILRNELEVHLSILKRQGFVESWHDRNIFPGEDINNAISAHLEGADIVLLLVSPDFLASEYCWGIELARAMKLHEAGRAAVIPVILRPCDWHNTPFASLLATPTDGLPVVKWGDRDDAYLDVARAIRRTIEKRATKGSETIDRQRGGQGVQATSARPSGTTSNPTANQDSYVAVIACSDPLASKVLLEVSEGVWRTIWRRHRNLEDVSDVSVGLAKERFGVSGKFLANLGARRDLKPELWLHPTDETSFGVRVLDRSYNVPIIVILEGDIKDGKSNVKELWRTVRSVVAKEGGSIAATSMDIDRYSFGKISDNDVGAVLIYEGAQVCSFPISAGEAELDRALRKLPDTAHIPRISPWIDLTTALVEIPFRAEQEINSESRGLPVQWFTHIQALDLDMRLQDYGPLSNVMQWKLNGGQLRT